MSGEAPTALTRMPAEWEPHAATWLAWPHRRDDWPGKFAPIPWVFAEVARHLTQCERVRLMVNDAEAERRARRTFNKSGVDLKQVDFLHIPTDRCWTRDYGPMFVRGRGGLSVLAWQFNGWAKYTDCQKDAQVPRLAADALKVPVRQAEWRQQSIVLEGGAIEVNAAGVLMTTEECLLSEVQRRNPEFDRADMEAIFFDYFLVTRVLWLGRGIAGDDTHGHVDDIARFVNPTTIVAAREANRDDPNHEPLEDNWQRLQEATDGDGRRFNVVALPMPAPVYFAGQRLPASYANFYIANDRVLVPTFNDPQDRVALGILADLFPGRKIVGVYARDLVLGLGTIHCMTQQEPVNSSAPGSEASAEALECRRRSAAG